MSKRKKGDYEKRFLLAVAKAARAKQQFPSHPIEATRTAIERAGGVAKWIKQDPMSLVAFISACKLCLAPKAAK
jgi:hypothetical protein